MAHVTIISTKGRVEVQDMDADGIMAMLDEWRDNESVLTVTLDDTTATHIASRHIVRIDIDT
ncbi:hypothetical protein BJD62_gp69 [Gordonia phage Lucky10]|uniref:Uncharacterized protein n=1 Tax=Gordonia phage Lucky10 TaxID=1821557 RepID=A0A142KB29_9CAUD|nr:hypothetical protein BJD62_gp69 [Gordonia phage Lucky10]AMS03312.1 hypothetical protein SEA_LUCKY10_69 [Gordonia phage Lucky10]